MCLREELFLDERLNTLSLSVTVTAIVFLRVETGCDRKCVESLYKS